MSFVADELADPCPAVVARDEEILVRQQARTLDCSGENVGRRCHISGRIAGEV